MDRIASIVNKLLPFILDPRIQSAVIAALVALGVALLATRTERNVRKAQRAYRLLAEVYNPIEVDLKRSLYSCIATNRDLLEKNRHNFPNAIRELIDQALKVFRMRPMFDSVDKHGVHCKAQLDYENSINELQKIEDKLIPLIEDEIINLKDIIDKEPV